MRSRTLLSSDYTFCNRIDSSSITCQSQIDNLMSFDKPIDQSCKCRLSFKLEEDIMAEKVLIYYGLKNFNQNYRFLAQSKDIIQLSGKSFQTTSTHCPPSVGNKTIAPCGGLANVMFDDEFTLLYESNEVILLDRYNIALDETRKHLYKNPPDINSLRQYSKPPRWRKDLLSLDQQNQSNNGFENGHFIVWMTLSTFDDFVKLYAIVNPTGNRLKAGTYNIDIDYRYGIYGTSKGRKIIRVETLSQVGSRNDRLLMSLIGLAIVYFLVFIVITFGVWRRWSKIVHVRIEL